MDDLLDTAPCGFLSFDDDGKLVMINATLRQMLGYEEAALLGRPISTLFSTAGRIFFHTHFYPLLKLQGGLQEMYFSLQCQNGDELAVLVNAVHRQRAGRFVNDCVLMPVRQRSLYEDAILKAKQAAEEASRLESQTNAMLEERIRTRTAELIESREQLRQFSSRLRDMLEEERARISRQVHDELGQMLTILKMQLAAISSRLNPDQQALRDRARDMSQYIDESIKTIRRIASDLRPPVLDDFGLIAALEWHLNNFELHTAIHCRLVANTDYLELDRNIATDLFRITQESLTNVMRHAHATEVEIHLTREPDALELKIQDNGKGITPSELSASKSLGIFGLRERAQLLGGTLDVRGAPGAGTTVTVRISLGPPSAPA